MMASTVVSAQEDPYLWLEEVMGEKAIAWVKDQNAKSQKEVEARAEFGPIRDKRTKARQLVLQLLAGPS